MARGYSSAPGASPEVEEARKPNLHRSSLAMHGHSKNPYVREIIAGRVDCPFGLMVTLAQDREPEVLLGLIANPSLPEHVLEQLVLSKRTEIREAAATRLDAGNLSVVAAWHEEDGATPELRDAVGLGGVSLYAVERPEYPNRPRSPFTRTAPVRGFRPPDAP